MKIAVLLFGHLRDFHKCADSIKENLLDHYECDVFIHTWDEIEPSTFSWHGQRAVNRMVDDSLRKTIEHKYSPKGIMIEHQEKSTDECIFESPHCNGFKFSTAGMHFMFYSMNKANKLRCEFQNTHNINYDYVLVTRPDVKLKHFLDISKICKQSEILGIDVNNCRYFASQKSTVYHLNALVVNQPNDLLFFAKPPIIDKYISINQNIDIEYLKTHTINIVSNYTSRELAESIIPMPISYFMGEDWSFSGSRYSLEVKLKDRSKLYKIMFVVLLKVFQPFFRFYRHHPYINYYLYE